MKRLVMSHALPTEYHVLWGVVRSYRPVQTSLCPETFLEMFVTLRTSTVFYISFRGSWEYLVHIIWEAAAFLVGQLVGQARSPLWCLMPHLYSHPEDSDCFKKEKGKRTSLVVMFPFWGFSRDMLRLVSYEILGKTTTQTSFLPIVCSAKVPPSFHRILLRKFPFTSYCCCC